MRVALRMSLIRIGTAGWSIHARYGERFPAEGTHLERYGHVLNAVEINSSFYRPHKRSTYQRWAASVPDSFRFAVKMPKAVTHERRLVGADALLDRFLDEAAGLGDRLGPLLVQLPPKLGFDDGVADRFFAGLRQRHIGLVACEPRHASWFMPAADALLDAHRIARVAADPPAGSDAAAEPGGWRGLIYLRLHGSPRIYYSDYDESDLRAFADRLMANACTGSEAWCIFDNTAAFEALGDALDVRRLTATQSGSVPGLRTSRAGADRICDSLCPDGRTSGGSRSFVRLRNKGDRDERP